MLFIVSILSSRSTLFPDSRLRKLATVVTSPLRTRWSISVAAPRVWSVQNCNIALPPPGVTCSSRHLLHCGFAALGPLLAALLLPAGPVLGAGRKRSLPQRVPHLLTIFWRSVASYFSPSKQKLWGDKTTSFFTRGNRFPFHCAQKPSISLPHPGGDSSACIQAASCLIHIESFTAAAMRMLLRDP